MNENRREELAAIEAEINRREELAAIEAEIKKREAASNNKNQGTINKYVLDPLKTTYNAAEEGAERVGAGLDQLAFPVVDKAFNTHLTDALKSERAAKEKAFNQQYGHDPYAKGMAFVTELAPAFVGGGAIDAAKAPAWLSKVATGMNPTVRTMADALGIGAKNAAVGAGYGLTNYDPTFQESATNKVEQGALYGGIGGTALAGLARAPATAKKLLTKVVGDTTPRELATVNEALKGYKTGLGDVINSPKLKQFQENVLSTIPFSGVEKSQQKTATQLSERGKTLLDQLHVPEYEEDVGSVLQNALIKNERAAQKNKRALYDEVDRLAEANGVKVGSRKYSNTAKAILNDLGSNKLTGSIQDSSLSELKGILKDIANDKDGTNTTIKDANIAIGLLKDKAINAHMEGKDYVSGKFYDLAHNLQRDLDESVARSGHEGLRKAYDKAQQFYKEKVVPFEDKDIARYIRKGADSDTIVNYFLKTGRNDRAKLLGKLLDQLGDNEKNAIGHHYLRQAYGEGKQGEAKFNPSKLVSIYNKLGGRTRQRLFNKEFRDQMDRYTIQVRKNPEALNAMYNPKTGHRLKDPATAGAIVAGALSHGLIPKMAIGTALTGGAANATNRLLNSEKLRQLYLEGLLPANQPGSFYDALAGAGAGAGSKYK